MDLSLRFVSRAIHNNYCACYISIYIIYIYAASFFACIKKIYIYDLIIILFCIYTGFDVCVIILQVILFLAGSLAASIGKSNQVILCKKTY